MRKEVKSGESNCCAPIDLLRRGMIEAGLSPDDAGRAVGLAAEYAQRAYMQGYDRGWADGVKKQNDQAQFREERA